MSSGKDAPAAEIIIVRRKGGDGDDHHHGGVWKIAYADFMTAMMAFFLVMWLINASNTETKASIASYFNPIKLTDNVSRKKGLLDLDEKANASEKSKTEKDPHTPASKRKEEKAKAAAKDGTPQAGASASPGSSKMAAAARKRDGSAENARAFRDPFTPLSDARLLAKDDAQQSAPPQSGAVAQPQSGGAQATPAGAAGTSPAPTPPQQGGTRAETAGQADRLATQLAESADQVRRGAEAAVRLLGAGVGPGVEVAVEGDAVVLSLTDTSTFGMFAVGSAEPNEATIKLIQTITPVLAANGDRIVVRGHTDSKPFRTDAKNNNWRLSMARAEAAYAMLLRAGIEEPRFERIEGYADRKPKIARDTEAAANRRIEIIMRRGTP